MSDHNFEENSGIRLTMNTKKDVFYEITIQSSSPYSNYIFYTYRFLAVAAFLIAIVALFFFINTGFALFPLLIMALSGLACYLFYMLGNNAKIEYDYTLTNNVLDIAKVINNNQRKKIVSVKIQNIQEMAPITNNGFQRYFADKSIKKANLFLNKGEHLYYFKTVIDNNPVVVVFEPDTEMVQLIREVNPTNVSI